MKTQCECGNWYDSPSAADACRSQKHYSVLPLLDEWKVSTRVFNRFEIDVTVNCAECNKPLRAEVSFKGLEMQVDVLPHLCEVLSPEDEAFEEERRLTLCVNAMELGSSTTQQDLTTAPVIQ